MKRVDTSMLTDGILDQQHTYYYSADWQIIEELVDEDWSEHGPASIDREIAYVWGARYIDDIVLRREIVAGEPPTVNFWYHLTDHQFSTVALMDNTAGLVERITYDAYGEARHHWPGDLTGDGEVNAADQTAMAAAYKRILGEANYNVDADITRTGTVDHIDTQWTATKNFKAAMPKGAGSFRRGVMCGPVLHSAFS